MSRPLKALSLPTVSELGPDLLVVSSSRRVASLLMPFVCLALYLLLASHRLWVPAVLAVMYLSFLTYGSVSHDLVHRSLRLPRAANEFLLTLIELLAFRSGHAYRLVHLNHHARFPHDDDVEGAAARMSLPRAIAEGFIYLPRLTCRAIGNSRRSRPLVIAETISALALLAGSFALTPVTPIFAVYAALMIMGSWLYPLATSYIPHNSKGESPQTQTRLFRGKVLALLALQHLYHLEHHLYPQVPHHNWPKLARRLDPHFEAAGIKPVILAF